MKREEFTIGVRYLRSGRRSHIVAFISRVSLIGIALGVAALLTVVSVMNGFEHELKSKILLSLAHITIEPLDGRLHDWQNIAQKLEKEHAEVVAIAPFVEAEAMVMSGKRSTGILLRGIAPEYETAVSGIGEGIVAGALSDLSDLPSGIILGQALAQQLGVTVGDKVVVMTSEFRITAAGLIPRLKRYQIVALFDFGMHSYDSRLAFLHIADAAKLLRMQDTVSGIRLRLEDEQQAPVLNQTITAQLGRNYWGVDWTRRHQNLFSAIKLQKKVMFIILTLVVAVAVFNLVATMVMTVREKRGDIAILRTLGMTTPGVMRVFMLLGTLIGVCGIVIGTVGGVILSFSMEYIVAGLENLLGIDLLSKEVYLISRLPGKIIISDLLLIVAITFLLSVLTTLYPAWKAAQTPPAEALNREV